MDERRGSEQPVNHHHRVGNAKVPPTISDLRSDRHASPTVAGDELAYPLLQRRGRGLVPQPTSFNPASQLAA